MNELSNKILKNSINNAVKNIIYENKQQKLDLIIENVVNKQISLLTEKKEKMSNKKRSVIQWLQQPEVNTAEIRRQLEGEPESQEEEDSKRSYFMKKVNQKNGKDFTSDEVNSLYALKSELGQ